jgi:hypothetical protein
MANGPTHRVEKVPLRDVWEREQQDFSRWLVDNIDYPLPEDEEPDEDEATFVVGTFDDQKVHEPTESPFA